MRQPVHVLHLQLLTDTDDAQPGPTQAQLRRHFRRHVEHELYDESDHCVSGGIAIYSLSDPSELRRLRYIGQTSSPRRRLLQHLTASRLWVPAERPWWIRDPKLRPLYEWIRTLYRAESRLPTMIVWEWSDSPSSARLAERARICEGLSRALPLLNVEAERAASQRQLL